MVDLICSLASSHFVDIQFKRSGVTSRFYLNSLPNRLEYYRLLARLYFSSCVSFGTSSYFFNNNLSEASRFIFKTGVTLLMILFGGLFTGSGSFYLGKSGYIYSFCLGSSFGVGVEIYQFDAKDLGSGVVDRGFS